MTYSSDEEDGNLIINVLYENNRLDEINGNLLIQDDEQYFNLWPNREKPNI